MFCHPNVQGVVHVLCLTSAHSKYNPDVLIGILWLINVQYVVQVRFRFIFWRIFFRQQSTLFKKRLSSTCPEDRKWSFLLAVWILPLPTSCCQRSSHVGSRVWRTWTVSVWSCAGWARCFMNVMSERICFIIGLLHRRGLTFYLQMSAHITNQWSAHDQRLIMFSFSREQGVFSG